jgi:UDP-N-acetylglucosamine diphosphorylase/glucosamine-1-phosphate N-acetyltransferase
VLAAAAPLRPVSTTVVIGHQADLIREAYAHRPDVGFVVQEPQLGTGHALLRAEPRLKDASGTVLLLYGDVPLLSSATLDALVGTHRTEHASATVLTATVDRPFGYGRIVRLAGAIARIVEERDTSPAEREIREINAGIYAFELGPLFDSIRGIATANAQGEYYLPDLVSIYRARGLGVTTVTVKNADEIRGINSRTELAEVATIVRQTKNEELMAAGVTIDSVSLDNGFTGWSRRAVIDWPELGARLVMTAGPPLDFLTVFIPPSLPFFCVEPVSHATDAVNLAGAASEVGRRSLEPGATLRASITLTPELIG